MWVLKDAVIFDLHAVRNLRLRSSEQTQLLPQQLLVRHETEVWRGLLVTKLCKYIVEK